LATLGWYPIVLHGQEVAATTAAIIAATS